MDPYFPVIRLCLLFSIAVNPHVSILAQDVPWLRSVTQPPISIPAPARPLPNLLVDGDNQIIETSQAWLARRTELIRLWNQDLGLMPNRPTDKTVITLERELFEWGTRELIEYAIEPGLHVQAYVLSPHFINDTPRAGIVALHPTTNLTISAIAGVAGNTDQHTAVTIAKNGFVVICPRCFLWQNAKDFSDAVAQHHTRHPGVTGVAKMLYDAQCAVDILERLPNVDPKRIGAFGHSLGAKEVLYLMAFDDRIRAGVASEGGIAFESTNWDAPWYLGPLATNISWQRNHHELLALTIPRPLLLIGGETGPGAADGTKTWPYILASSTVYRVFDLPNRIGLINHGQGHPLPSKELLKGIEWLINYTSVIAP